MMIKLNDRRRDYLDSSDPGIGWCLPVASKNGRVWMTRNEGKYDEPVIDGLVRPDFVEHDKWERMALDAAGVVDKESLIENCVDCGGCRNCPFFLLCEVWDDEIELDGDEPEDAIDYKHFSEQAQVTMMFNGIEYC